MVLTNESSVVTKRDRATHLNHEIIFRYEIQNGQTRPSSVMLQFYPVGTVNINPNNNNVTIDAQGILSGRYDTTAPSQLIADITAKSLELINGTEAE